MLPLSSSPKFSVIIATYNGEKTLLRAIDSVLAQAYSAYEIIIIDDGSTDSTSSIVSNYGDKVIYHLQENSGVSAARNNGAKLAQGDWLAFLDADDWYYPQRLFWHAEFIQRNPDTDFLIGDYHYGRADGTIIGRSIDSNAFGLRTLGSADELDSVLLGADEMGELIPSYFGHTLTFSVSRQKFLSLGGYPEAFSIGEDLHLIIRLCATSCQVGVSCKPMGVYCVHESGLIRSDVVKSQSRTVETLASLKAEMKDKPTSIRNGYLMVLLDARYNLATALIRGGWHLKAIMSFLPALGESFSWHRIKMLLSIIKG